MSEPKYIDLLEEELDFIFKFLKDKNEKYGSSIMEPLGIFHKGTTIEAINAGDSAYLIVSDNGTGVPLEFKPHLFELLSSTRQAGMGLGLWLCKHIVTRNGGLIYYEEAHGEGAKFVVKFPR